MPNLDAGAYYRMAGSVFYAPRTALWDRLDLPLRILSPYASRIYPESSEREADRADSAIRVALRSAIKRE